MDKLLVIEHIKSVSSQLISGLSDEFMVLEASDCAHAMELFLCHAPKVVAIELGPSGGAELSAEGFRYLDWLLESRPGTKVVALVDEDGRATAYRAIARGAYDFHCRPVELAELKIIFRRAFQLSHLEEQRFRLQEALELYSASVEGIAGQCGALKELFTAVQKVAPFELSELSKVPRFAAGSSAERGSSGTGEEAHAAKRRSGGGMGRVQEVPSAPGSLTLREARDRVEKGMISAAIDSCRGNIAKASEFLGVSRPALYDLMKKHGLVKPGAQHHL